MAQYSNLTIEQVKAICADYEIYKIHTYKILSGGSENTNYLITSTQGKYVLTICEQKSEQKARELSLLLEHLAENHFQTSKIVQNTEDEPVTLWEGKPVMVKKYIEGKVIDDLSLTLLQLIGGEIAKLHKIEAPSFLPTQIDYGRERFHEVGIYAAGSVFEKWLQEKLEYVTPCFSLHLSRALIHSDVFDNNVIISDNESSAIIMDFEEACHYYRIFDIGMAIIGTCREGQTVNFEKATQLVKGYLKETTLSKEELGALHAFTVYAGASMTFWRHINFNYIKPDPNMFDHYMGLKVLTDNVQQWNTDCFLTMT
ncbi:MAG: homoserine kinase type II [Saprospiraceae bacterium]|jgi:homoserine kinase type II